MPTSRAWTGSRILVALALLAAALAVGGCCTASLLLKPCTPTDRLVLTPGQKLNACDPPNNPVSHPVAVRIYELKKVDNFQDMEFAEVWDEDAIKGDLAAETQEYSLEPGGAPLSLALPRPQGAVAIGVVVAFCHLEGGCWRKVITLDKPVAAKLSVEGLCLKLVP